MKLRATLVSILTLLLILISLPVCAVVEVPVFEGVFDRGTGAPEPDIRTFDVIPELSGDVLLRVYNGAVDGAYDFEKVSSSQIFLNSTEILSSESFNQNVGFIEKTVALDPGENTLKCILKSKPGGTLQVKIFKPVDAEAAAVAGHEGISFSVNNPESPLFNYSVVAPEGSVQEDTLIIIKEVYDIPPTDGLKIADKFLSVESSKELIGYVLVKIPNVISVEGFFPEAKFFNETTNQWEWIPSTYNFDTNTLYHA